MKYEDVIAIKTELMASEFVPGSYVYYPNTEMDGRFHKGIIKEELSNGIPDAVTIENDQNTAIVPSSINSYSKRDLQPVLINRDMLIEEFGFREKRNSPLYGLPCENYFEREFDNGNKLQMIEAETARFCMVIQSDAFYGCSFIPVIYVHILQRILAAYT